VSTSGRQVRPRLASIPAATSASVSRASTGVRIPERADNTKPRYWVSPSYTHSSSSCIGVKKSPVASPAGRRNLPFHEWVSSWERRFEW